MATPCRPFAAIRWELELFRYMFDRIIKYIAGILIILAIASPFFFRPWPEMQFILLPFIAILWLYSKVLAKVFRLKELPDIKDKKPACDILSFSVGITSALFTGIPFAFHIFPWVEQCALQKSFVASMPTGAICIILISMPIGFYGIRVATLKIANEKK